MPDTLLDAVYGQLRKVIPLSTHVAYLGASRLHGDLIALPTTPDNVLPCLASFPLRDYGLAIAGLDSLFSPPGGRAVRNVDLYKLASPHAASADSDMQAVLAALGAHLEKFGTVSVRARAGYCTFSVCRTAARDRQADTTHIHVVKKPYPTIIELLDAEYFCWDGSELLISELGVFYLDMVRRGLTKPGS